MELEEKDVNVSDPSPDNETIDEGDSTSTPQEDSTESQVVNNETSGEETKKVNNYVPYDRFNEVISQKNDYERKYFDLQNSLPEMIKKAVSDAVPQNNNGTPKYTKEELIRFKNSTDNAEHRAWAEIELENVRREETRKEFESIREKERLSARLDNEKREALLQVMSLYPVAFKNGSWDNSHPLTQRIAQVYNSDPALQQHGHGLLAAAKMAFADYISEQQPNIMKEKTKMKQQIKKLEKATLIEGAGVSNTPKGKTELQKAIEQFNKSGKEEDLKRVMILRSRLKNSVAQGE